MLSISLEHCIRSLPSKLAALSDLHASGAYGVAVAKYLKSGNYADLQPLLSQISFKFGVGPLSAEVVEYIVETRLLATITAPFRLHGAPQFLTDFQTVHDVCGIENFDARSRPFPAVRIGHDQQGTTFYMFLSNQIRIDETKQTSWSVDGLAGLVLSLHKDAIHKVSKSLADNSADFGEFLFKLAHEGCFSSITHLIGFAYDLHDLGIVKSPCNTREQMDLALHKMKMGVFENVSLGDLEGVLSQHQKYEFLVNLLDYEY